jgi:hypothetical protein
LTAPVPATVDTLAVQLAALDRRLTDALVARDREEKVRAEELMAWREAHNNLLRFNSETVNKMQNKDEYEQCHKALESKIESDGKFIMQRLDSMDSQRNAMKVDLTTVMARAGYVSAGFIMAAVSLVIALGVGILDFLHPLVMVGK